MILVILDLLFVTHSQFPEEGIMMSVSASFENHSTSKFWRATHAQKFLERRQAMKGNPTPQGCPSPSNEKQSSLAARSLRFASEKKYNGAFNSCESLTFVNGQRPCQSQRNVHSQKPS